MCTIINIRKNPILLKQDLTVYKIIQKSFHSTYAGFPYIPDKKNEQSVKKELIRNNTGPFDCREETAVRDFIKKKPSQAKNLRAIKEGFHFAFHKERLLNCFPLTFRSNNFLAVFTIPKGSLVYRGIDDSLGVSNCIILNKEQPYLK